mgnify:CR=1 FL=1
MPSKKRALSGFAIVEVLVATVVLAIGFLELARAFRNINSVANQAVAMTKASNLAHATMERIMAQNFDARGNDLEFGDYALDFDGTNDYVGVGDVHGDIQTISFWVRADDISAHTDYVLDLNGVAYITIIFNGTQGSVTAVGIDSPTYYLNAVSGERTITTGTWYHVAITTATSINASDVTIGGLLEHPGPGYFNGKLDEVRLWADVRTDILANHNRSIANPYTEDSLKLYLRMNNQTGTVAFDHSSNRVHGNFTNPNDPDWVTGYSTSLGREGETMWSKNNDVDDFHTISFVDNDYDGLDSATNDFTGMGGRVYVKYISLNGGSGTSGDPYTFNDSVTPTDYKQITVKVGIPGTTDSTQIDAIKSAKVDQGYGLTFSPYGL